MKGWVMAAQNAFKNDEDLVSWLEKAKKFERHYPPNECLKFSELIIFCL